MGCNGFGAHHRNVPGDQRLPEYGHDGYDGYNYKECVDELCDFYKTFTPTKETKKKMTKAEIEDALGYKIEIVEE
jgi:hypothetical protein